MDLEGLNAASADEFAAALDGLWEHSPWVVARAAHSRPFSSQEALDRAMWDAVRTAPPGEQLSLLCAHPDLAGRLARAGRLTEASANEQASLGLDRLSDEEYEAFSAMNAAYREKFGFPFIICVRDNTKASVREAFEKRLKQERAEEIRTALEEVRKIAGHRLNDRMKS